MSTDVLLPIALEAAVALRIAELRRLPAGAFSDLYEGHRLERLSDLIGSHADDMLFRGGKPGMAKDVFNAVADALAVLAFAPGGVELFGTRWVATR